jgi:hypothetical protein
MGSAILAMALAFGPQARAGEVCQKYGPQTPRDIGNKNGTNPGAFALAPAASQLNLCNMHFHANAEHKGPGFSVFAGKGEHGGFKCNDTPKLSAAELKAPEPGACHGIKPGDTIEVHWVYSSCAVSPGSGLEACLSEQCANPVLRVESQVFLVVNSGAALNFSSFTYAGNVVKGVHQPKALPAKTGKPVVFRGSTTGPKYTEQKCSPLQATWSVRPACAKLDINSLDRWCAGNVFKEDHAHGVRELVTTPELLARIN